MTRSIRLLVAFVLLFPAVGWGQVKLEHKYPDGAKATYITAIKSEQKLTLLGQDIPSKSEQTITTSKVNGQRGDDGKLAEQHTVEAFQTSLNVSGIELTYDSKKPDAAPAGTQLDSFIDVFKALGKSKWTVVRGADNRVLSIEGRDDAFQTLPEEMRALLQKQFEPSYLVERANRELDRVPSRPIKVGESWEVTDTMRLEGGQTMTFTTRHEYAGTTEKENKSFDKITSQATAVTYALGADSPLPIKLVNGNLKVAESEGVLLFDRAAGQVAESHDRTRITGELTFEANNMQLPGTLDLTLEVSSKLVP